MVSASTGFDGSSARGKVGKTEKKEVFCVRKAVWGGF